MVNTKVLIVEDEKIVAKEIEIRLKKLGYTVSASVQDGVAAVKNTAKLLPDLVLMDIKLQGDMDGIEAANLIRSSYNIPIIYLTAFADDETLQRAKLTEPFGYLLKPFETKELHSTIEMAIYRHKTEKLLQENEKRYRTIFEHSNDSIIIYNITGEILNVNERACEMLSYERKQLIGKNIKSCHPKSE